MHPPVLGGGDMSGMHSVPTSSAGGHVAGSGLPSLVCMAYQPPVVVGEEVYSLGHSAYLPLVLVGERQVRARSGLPCVPCCLIWLPNRQVSTSGAIYLSKVALWACELGGCAG